MTEIAARNNVSQKFTDKQQNIANQTLEKSFKPIPKSDDVIFYLPVTKKWIRSNSTIFEKKLAATTSKM